MGHATFQLPIRRTPRCVLPTNATHYLTNCTRALRFLSSLVLCLATLFGAEKIDAFSRRLRSLPREVPFLPWELFVPRAWFLFASLVSSPRLWCRLRAFAWWSVYERRVQDRSSRAPVKGDARIAIRNEFHRWALELSSLFLAHGFAAVREKKRVVFCSPQFRSRSSSRFRTEELTPNLPRRALAPAHAFCAPLLVEVTGSRFVFREVSVSGYPRERSNNRPSSISATES